MQVRLSWQMLAAILIFLLAICVLGSSLMRAFGGPSRPAATPPVATAAASAGPAAVAVAATATAPPESPAPAASPTAEAASPTATETPQPSATPTLEPTAAPTFEPTATATPAPSATPAPEPLRLVAAGFAQPAGVLAYAFTVTNPNQSLMVRDTRYQLVAYDDGGIVIKTDTGTVGPVGPGGQTGVAAFLELVDGRHAARVDVILGGGLFLQPIDAPPIVGENLAFVAGDRPLVTGLLRNPYSKDLEDLPVAVILYGADGTIIGGGSASVPFIPAGGQAAAEVPVLSAGDPARIEIYPRLDAIPAL